MIRSMTGFGIAVSELDNKIITVEMRSVNSKFLDLNLRLPSSYKDKDLELRNELSKELERGKIDIAVTIEYSDDFTKVSINKTLIKAYFDELKSLDADYKISSSDYLNIIMRFPEVFNVEKREIDEEEWSQIKKVIDQAKKAYLLFRDTEGKALETDLKNRLKTISKLLEGVEKLEGPRAEAVRKKLTSSLEEFIKAGNIDRNRLEQEMIYYIEKIDISEEKTRLKSHCDYFISSMNEPTSNGKKLGFIAQEIGREINTIGSKANDAEMQKIVVDMKDELEKIKEQLMNVI
jgi:uncharacterized protein (TIGR00255 family)